MAADFFYPPSKNLVQKELQAQLLNSATTGDAITFSDADGIQNKPGVLAINRVDANGEATPSSREYISYSGTSGNTVLIQTRNVDGSSSAKTHAVGSIVEFIPDVVWAQRMIDQFLIEHNQDGTHDIAAMISGGVVIDDDTMATASATTISTSESVKEYVDANAGAGGKFMFVIPGTAAAGTDVAGTWFAPGSITITAIDLHADTAGATGSTVIDVNKNGTSIYPSASKPTLADTATSDTGNVPDTTTGVANDKYTIDIDSITTTAPTDLYVVIKYTE